MECVYLPWLFLAQFLMLIITGAAKVPAIIVFGDSSVDAGNNNQISTMLKSNFRPYGRDFFGGKATGRFSNGRIPPDFISEGFGLRPFVPAYLDPMYKISDFAAGVCFASAGTGFDNSTSAVLNVLPVWKEVEYYKDYQKKLKAYVGEEKAKFIISEALYLISMGTNDFLENYYTLPDRQSQYSVDQYQVFLLGLAEKFIKEIYGLGARKMALAGLPPMGCLPLERTTNFFNGNGERCNDGYNTVALHFNQKLSGLVNKLNKELPGIRLVLSNPYNMFVQIIKKPSLFGFDVAAVACCSTGMFEMGYLCDQMNPFTCSDASKYVFWDSFHPTEKTNKILSEYLLNSSLRQFL
ncbi:GDSL esterase/lipase At4g26790-like [Olea europaea var. sylvestris]|uniref:GDSL esterase/lipase At4g26790-like n=1 Tax=Olea europaea var. sylvestris TaxID=158386 RepID=UPI000C1D2346|nr:GDSL esterase/lipase At4g26790-like [Olea europaea var. sylvestris]